MSCRGTDSNRWQTYRSKQLDQALHAIRTLSSKAPVIELSYFETLFLASMIIFRATGVDRAVIETGLGGRLMQREHVSQTLQF